MWAVDFAKDGIASKIACSFFIHLDKRCFWKRGFCQVPWSHRLATLVGEDPRETQGVDVWEAQGPWLTVSLELVGGGGDLRGSCRLCWWGMRTWRCRLWAPAYPEVPGAYFCFSLAFWAVFSPLFFHRCLWPVVAALDLPRFTGIPSQFPCCVLDVSSWGQLACQNTHPLLGVLLGFLKNIANICVKLLKHFIPVSHLVLWQCLVNGWLTDSIREAWWVLLIFRKMKHQEVSKWRDFPQLWASGGHRWCEL